MNEHALLTIRKTPVRMVQACTMHFGIVRSVDDPLIRGRVLVECPSLFGTDEEHWAGWCDFVGHPTGSMHKKGDLGIWWAPVPGLLVLMGFEGGNKNKPYCLPAGPWGDEGKPFLPADAKARGKKAVHVRVLKSEAGHTLLFDDNGKEEAAFLCDWTGAGWFSMAPGKKEDEKSSNPCSATRMRKGEMRGDRSAFNGEAKKPSELVEGETTVLGHLDLNGQGWLTIAKDGEGSLVLYACTEKGEIGPSIILDSKEDRILLTAGETQLVINGKKGHLEATRIRILESTLVEVKDAIKGVYDSVKEYFKKYKEQKT